MMRGVLPMMIQAMEWTGMRRDWIMMTLIIIMMMTIHSVMIKVKIITNSTTCLIDLKIFSTISKRRKEQVVVAGVKDGHCLNAKPIHPVSEIELSRFTLAARLTIRPASSVSGVQRPAVAEQKHKMDQSRPASLCTGRTAADLCLRATRLLCPGSGTCCLTGLRPSSYLPWEIASKAEN